MSKLHLKDNPTLDDIQAYVEEMCRQRGFDRDSVPQKFMMLMEEVGEMAKASRKDVGMQVDAKSDKRDVASEAADVLIVFASLCNALGINLEQALREKEELNKTRTWK